MTDYRIFLTEGDVRREVTFEERLKLVGDLYEWHTSLGCGKDVPGPYEDILEHELLSKAHHRPCASCLSRTSRRDDRSWFRHSVF